AGLAFRPGTGHGPYRRQGHDAEKVEKSREKHAQTYSKAGRIAVDLSSAAICRSLLKQSP
ncbi:MAG: hypothetical protein ACO204_03705, partial [Schleiferiaceae bacterium]